VSTFRQVWVRLDIFWGRTVGLTLSSWWSDTAVGQPRLVGTAAIADRFAENGLIRILAHQAGRDGQPTDPGRRDSQPASRHLGLVELRAHQHQLDR
jgi:hypothetical protein